VDVHARLACLPDAGDDAIYANAIHAREDANGCGL